MFRGEYVTRVGVLCKDKSLQTDANEINSALTSAIATYGKYVPNLKVKAYESTGVRLYALPDDWARGVSENFDIEYPVDDDAGQVTLLDKGSSEIYPTPDGYKLRFRSTANGSNIPTSGSAFRLRYPVPHVLTDAESSVSDGHFEAVCKLACRELCLILSTRFAQQASGIGGSDAADYRDKSDKFLKLAEVFFDDFMDEFSPDPDELVAAGTFGEFIDNPLHRDYDPTFPRDGDGRYDL